MANPIIDLDNISVTFKQRKQVVHAVKDVTLKVEKGDIYGIVGYSGAGKSTLVRTINLLQLPSAGSVTVNGTVFFSLVSTYNIFVNLVVLFAVFNSNDVDPLF